MNFSIIAAADEKMGIGIENRLPWKLPGDLKHFSEVTMGVGAAGGKVSKAGSETDSGAVENDASVTREAPGGKINAVIMGSNTWKSLPDAHRPLSGRVNIVLNRSEMELPEGVLLAHSFDEALEKAGAVPNLGEVFVIGGASVYAFTIERPECTKIYLTEVLGEFECDTFFPEIPLDRFKRVNESEVMEENGIMYRFVEYGVVD